MEKIVRTLTIIFFISITLFANTTYLNKVYSYDKKISIANDSEMLRIFQSLQNIYIKSIINNDKKLKIETLKRLIKSAEILHFNVKDYKNELFTLLGKQKKQPKLINQEQYIKKTHKKLKNESPDLINLSINDKNINLVFNKKISSKEIRTFSLSSRKNYKKVYDFNGFLSIKPKIKIPKIFKTIRIAQFDNNIFRLVLVTKKVKKYYLKIYNNNIVIYFYKHAPPKKAIIFNKNTIFAHFNPRNKIIVLDPGHGGKDSGAIGYKGRYEKKAVLEIALKCAHDLRKKGYKVYLTRTNDTFVTLRNRTNFANIKHADLFISIHANAAPKRREYLSMKGLETFFLSPARSQRSKNVAAQENRSVVADMDYYTKSTFLNVINREKIVQSNKVALDIQQDILRSVRTKYRVVDGGVREAPFWVLIGAQMPSILIETGYITNPTEGTRLFNFQYQNLLAKGIANGVDSYFLKNY